MLNMSQINNIKEMARKGYTIAHIARQNKISEKTVRKYLHKQDFSPKPPQVNEFPSKLDRYKETIDKWLLEDKDVWYKQRHTGKRIHARLKAEFKDFNVSYETVQRYIKKSKQMLQEQQGFQELVWHPGEAQVDFGAADFSEQGERIRKKFLTVSFPYSNNSFSQVFGGETSECVCQGLKDIFEYIGGVPPLLVFDNATGVGRRIGQLVQEAQLFQRMRAHYRFSVRFCNPNAGHEKGNVENKVGYTRHNLFVPVPVIDDIVSFNRKLLDDHKTKAEENHYKKIVSIQTLFDDDRKALMKLPTAPFDVCRYNYVKADGYGKVRLDDRHYYSTSPEFGNREVLVGVRAHTVDILVDGTLLVRHSRQFGEKRSDTVDYRTSLAMLMKNAGAWPNSGVRELVPDTLRDVMDEQPRDELQSTLRTMQLLTRTYSFETAVAALEEGLRINRTNFCDAAILAARIAGYGLDRPPESGPDLRIYDDFLNGGEVSC